MKAFVVEAEWEPKPDYVLSPFEQRHRIARRGDCVWKNPTWRISDSLSVTPPAAGQVVIKVMACGVCGSDTSLLETVGGDYISFSSQCAFPCVPGHEVSGVITETGSGVREFCVGDMVTVEGISWCGYCSQCRQGNHNQCENLRQLGFDLGLIGGFSEYITVDEKCCWDISPLKRRFADSALFQAGATVEPIAVAYEGMFSVAGGFLPGSCVAVFGAGTTGVAAIQLAKAAGASQIIVFEPSKFRREMALSMGADQAYDPYLTGEDTSKMILELTRGQGVAMGIDTSGAPSLSIQQMEPGLSVGGKIVVISMAHEYPRVDMMSCLRKKNALFGTFGHAGHGNFGNVIRLLASGRIDITPFVTKRVPLDGAAEAILASSDKSHGKSMIICNS